MKLPLPSIWRRNGGVQAQLHSFSTSENRWVWSTSCPGHSTSAKESSYSLSRRVGGPKSWSPGLWEDKNLFSQPGFENRTLQPVSQSVTNIILRLTNWDMKPCGLVDMNLKCRRNKLSPSSKLHELLLLRYPTSWGSQVPRNVCIYQSTRRHIS